MNDSSSGSGSARGSAAVAAKGVLWGGGDTEVGDGGGSSKVEVVGPALMKCEINSSVSFGVTFSTTVNDGSTRTVVG